MNRPYNILVLTYFSLQEGLTQAYVLPYLRIIRNLGTDTVIHMVTQEKEELTLSSAERKSQYDALTAEGIIWHGQPYTPFGPRAMRSELLNLKRLRRLIKTHRIDKIHIWGTTPGIHGYLLSRWTGVPLVIDSFEPHAEAQLENGSWTKLSLGYRVLKYFERKAARRASTLIYTTRNMIEYSKDRYGAYDAHEFVKPACVDLDQFSYKDIKDTELLEDLDLKDKRVMMYAGKFGGIYHDHHAFRYMKAASDHWKEKIAFLLLGPTPRAEIEAMCRSVDLDPRKVISKLVPHKEIPRYMGLADFAIALIKSVPTKKCCTPIKDGEYWALGLPIVITKDISDDSDIIAMEKIGHVLQDMSEEEFKRSFETIDQLLDAGSRQEIYNRIRPIAEKYRNFAIAHKIYKEVYP